MAAVTASEARKTLFGLIKQVNDDRKPVEITSRHGNAVLIALDDYESMEETAYLLRSPENARRLMEGLAQARARQVEVHDLIDVDDESDA